MLSSNSRETIIDVKRSRDSPRETWEFLDMGHWKLYEALTGKNSTERVKLRINIKNKYH
jgi:hypothetical protein